MNIDLPEIDWDRLDWSAASQLKKIAEEFGEVAEAVALSDPINTIREALDTMQTCATLISMVAVDYNLNLDRFFREHKEKLQLKGYLKEG